MKSRSPLPGRGTRPAPDRRRARARGRLGAEQLAQLERVGAAGRRARRARGAAARPGAGRGVAQGSAAARRQACRAARHASRPATTLEAPRTGDRRVADSRYSVDMSSPARPPVPGGVPAPPGGHAAAHRPPARDHRASPRHRCPSSTRPPRAASSSAAGDGVDHAAVIARRNRAGRLEWCLPKGHLEGDETPEQAAVREIAEETGITGQVLRRLGVIDYWFTGDDRRVHKVVHHFLLGATAGYLTVEGDPDGEAEDVAWVPVAELPGMPGVPERAAARRGSTRRARRRGMSGPTLRRRVLCAALALAGALAFAAPAAATTADTPRAARHRADHRGRPQRPAARRGPARPGDAAQRRRRGDRAAQRRPAAEPVPGVLPHRGGRVGVRRDRRPDPHLAGGHGRRSPNRWPPAPA